MIKNLVKIWMKLLIEICFGSLIPRKMGGRVYFWWFCMLQMKEMVYVSGFDGLRVSGKLNVNFLMQGVRMFMPKPATMIVSGFLML